MKYESEFLYTKRRDDRMYGLYARSIFIKGERIINVNSGDKWDERDFRTIETDAGHFVHPEGMFTNHSCDPSATVDKSGGFLVAIRDIQFGEEITFNYLESEEKLVSGFTCKCGAENCIGKIGG